MSHLRSYLATCSTLICWDLGESLVQQVECLNRATLVPRDEDALRAALGGRAACVLLYLLPERDIQQKELWTILNTARANGGSVALIAVAMEGYSAYSSVLEGVRAGITSIVEASPRLDLHELRSAILEAERCLGSARAWKLLSEALSTALTDPAATLLRRTIMLADEPVTLSALADACQLHERSIRKYCARHGLPEPGRIIALCRLLRAALALDDGMTRDAVCSHLAFPSGEALRKLAFRTLGVPLSHLNKGIAAALVCAHLRAEILGNDERPKLALVR